MLIPGRVTPLVQQHSRTVHDLNPAQEFSFKSQEKKKMVYPDFEPTAFSFPLLHLFILKDGRNASQEMQTQEMHPFILLYATV